MMLLRRFGVPLLAMLVTLPAGAAEAEALRVKLSFTAPPTCPAEAQFIAAVEDRGGRFQGAGGEAKVRRLEVSLQLSQGEYRGTLIVHPDRGESTRRSVHAPQCPDVIKGLAVVAAIALGGTGEEGSPPKDNEPSEVPAAPPPPSSSGPASQPSPSLPPPKPAVPRPSQPVQPKVAEGPRRIRSGAFERLESVEVGKGKLRFDDARYFTLSGGAQVGLVPGLVMPRLQLTIARDPTVTLPSGESRLLNPLLETQLSLLGPATLSEPGYSTDVVGLAAGIRGCSVLTYDSDGFSLQLCAEFGFGMLLYTGRSSDGQSKISTGRGFGQGGVVLKARHNIGNWFHVEAQAGAQAQYGDLAIPRPTGWKAGDAVTPGAYGTIGAGVHFW